MRFFFFRSHFSRPFFAAILAACILAIVRADEAASTGAQGEYVTAVFGANTGLPQPIEDVIQSKDGYLWIGTQAGVVRFDGMRFTLYRAADHPGLQYNAVQCLLEDRNSGLWVGTDRGLSRFQHGTFEAIGPSSASITCLAEDRDGVIWIGTKQGVLRYQNGELHPMSDEPLLTGKTIRDLTLDRDGRMWIAPLRSSLLYYQNGTLKVFEHQGKRLDGVEMIAQAQDGTLWFSTVDNGVFRLHREELKNFGPEDGLGSRIAAGVYVDHRDNVWVVANGVYLFGRGGPERFGSVFSRVIENFHAITEDREGNLWMGTHANGLIRVTPTALRVYSEEHLLPGGSVRSVAEDHQGNLWLAVTQQPVVSIDPHDQVTVYDPKKGYAYDPYATFVAADGSVWAGGRRSLQVLRDGTVESYSQFSSVRALFQDHTGGIWIAPETGPVSRYANGRFETIGGVGNVPAAPADCFAEDTQGTVYIGLYRSGLVAYKDGAAKLYDINSGLPANDIRAVYADKQDNIWLGTKGRGLAVLANGRWWNPQAFSDLFQDQVSAIIEDDRGNLFLGTLKGVFYARTKDLLTMAQGGPIAHVHAVVLGDGIRSDSVYSSTQPVVWKAHDGTLWFATRQGLFGINPKTLGADKVPPPVFVERATVENRPVSIEHGLQLPAGARSLSIEYTALGFTRPEEVLFKYMLEGYDESWNEVGTRRTAYYNNLAPGKYRFRVIACNDDGVWNEIGATLEIEQRPWFYQRAWFRLLVVAVFGGAALVLYRWRVRVVNRRAAELQRQNLELERRIAERTAELGKSYEALRVSEYFYHSLVENLPQIIAQKDAQGRFTYANNAFGELVGIPRTQVLGKTDQELYSVDRAAKNRADDLRVMETGQPIEYEIVAEKTGGSKSYLHVKKVPLYDDQKKPIGVLLLYWDMSVFRETEEKLKQAQRELVETSRLAGMAEVATGVLHNIGNVLNSVNTSARIAAEHIHGLKIPGIGKIAQLLTEQSDRLVDFLINDARGRQLPSYMTKLTEHLERQRDEAMRELSVLQHHIEHIKEIVMVQQSHARVSGITEIVPPAELVEYAVRIGEVSLQRHGVTVTREFMPAPPVRVERQKVLQILVNLVRNAKESLDAAGRTEKLLTLGVRLSSAGRVQISVADNGGGIAPENLTRIFAFGFTTKKDGHGFGLHSSALAAKEMGGSLTAESAGPGRGATFILELPPAPETAEITAETRLDRNGASASAGPISPALTVPAPDQI